MEKTKLQIQLENLTKKIAQDEAKKIAKENIEKQRKIVRDREARNRAIFKAGGMVEKMGLLDVDEALLLGWLCVANEKSKTSSLDQLNAIREKGKNWLTVGKKMSVVRPEMPQLPRMIDPEPLPVETEQPQ